MQDATTNNLPNHSERGAASGVTELGLGMIPREAGFAISLSAQSQVATFTLQRPERRNSQNPLMWSWLLRSFNDLPGSIRIVVIRAQGQSFSAGLDHSLLVSADGAAGPLQHLAADDPDKAAAQLGRYQEAFAAFARASVTSIALVQGHAIGAGFQLALACDLRIASTDAQFRMAETSLGLVPDLGGTKRLLDLVGYSRAVSICLTGRTVSADEAERLGLVNAVVAPEALSSAGEELVQLLLAQPRSAVTETKALLLSALINSQPAQEQAERLAQLRQLRELCGSVSEDDPTQSP